MSVSAKSKKGALRPGYLLAAIGLLLTFFPGVDAQTSASSNQNSSTGADKGSSLSDKETPIGSLEEEMRAKRAIKFLEKEYRENLGRARELAQLATEVQGSYKTSRALSREDSKKLDRIEKLTKRVRSQAGGSEEDVKVDNLPGEPAALLGRLAEMTDTMKKNVENTPRHVVSASVIEQANVILELIRLVRSASLSH